MFLKHYKDYMNTVAYLYFRISPVGGGPVHPTNLQNTKLDKSYIGKNNITGFVVKRERFGKRPLLS